jgi:iron(III) transport system permease protein
MNQDVTAARRPLFKRFVPRISGDKLLMVLAVLAVLYIVGIPLIADIFAAFRGPIDRLPFEDSAVFTLSNFSSAYGERDALAIIRETALFAGGAVVLAAVIGFTLAYLVERTDIPFRNVIFVLALVPIMMPPIVTALAWIFLLGENNGLINVFIRAVFGMDGSGPFSAFSFFGMIWVQGLTMSSLAFLLMSASLKTMDSSLEEASAASGGSTFHTLRRVTLPILRPAVLSTLVLLFILAIEAFDVPLVLGARTKVFANTVYFALNPVQDFPRYGEVAALSLSFLAFTYVLFFIYSHLTRQANRFATVTGKGYRPKRFVLGIWKYPALAFVLGFSLIQFVFPLLILLWASLLDRFIAPSFNELGLLTLDAYTDVFSKGVFWGALKNTLIVAVGAATIVAFFSTIVAWIVVRSNMRGKRVLDLVASSSLAIPSVIAGVAFIIFYLSISRWVPIYGTVWVLVLAYSFRFSLAYRINSAGVVQLGKELEEASVASGATMINTFRHVIMPLLAPSMFIGFILIFFLAFRDFTMAFMLGTSENKMLSVMVWNGLQSNNTGEAAAVSILIVAILAIAVGILRGLVLPRIRGF